MQRRALIAGVGFGAIGTAAILAGAAPPPQRGHAVVAADQVLASEAGAEVLAKGGNAVDAVVAAALATGVVQPSACGLGGGGFAVLVDPAHGVRATLDFRDQAPAAATRDMYLGPDHEPIPDASVHGGLSVAIPGEPRGLWKLHALYGKLPMAEVAAPAIRLASDGFAIAPFLGQRIADTKLSEIIALFSVGGVRLHEDEISKRASLARTIARWVKSGGEDLSTGPGALAIAKEVAADHGILTAADLAQYQPKTRDPIVATYRGYTVVTMAPPSSGGVALAEMLGELQGFDVASLGFESAAHLHLLSEVMEHAFADRAHDLGDPDFVTVPVDRILAPEHLLELQRDFWPSRTFPPEHYGSLIEPGTDHGTEHISALDKDGMGVALTTTINTTFGSGIVVDDLGVILNDQMDDFSVAPGVPNSYGLVGAEANAIAGGKRPLSSMSPTVVLGPDGKVVMVVGASGGSQIISAVLQVVSDVIDFQMDPQEAVAAPRVHHQWAPNDLVVEPGIPKETIDALTAIGHHVVVRDHFSCAQVIVVGADGIAAGGADPRKGGWPASVW